MYECLIFHDINRVKLSTAFYQSQASDFIEINLFQGHLLELEMACGTKNAKEQLQEVEEVTDACGGRRRALLLLMEYTILFMLRLLGFVYTYRVHGGFRPLF